jgi:tetratricopeptide (TPR) repeat protein
VREAVAAIPAGDPARAVLDGVVTSLAKSASGDLSLVAPRLFAYGRSLDFRGRWRVAIDVYRTLLDFAHPLMDADVATDASLRIGYCSRVLGEWDDARAGYARAAEIAAASGDEAGTLRSRVGLANLARDRGNVPEAEALLDDVLARTTSPELADVRRVALHDRSAVAYLRGDAAHAVRLAHEAMRLTMPGVARDRLLADIGTYFAALGVREAARDAHLVVAHTAQEQFQRWSSLLALVELAALDADEAAFDAFRAEMAGAALPPELAVLRALYEARGHAAFGRAGEARTAAREALERARASGQHRYVFEAESLLEELAAKTVSLRPAAAAAPGDLAPVAREIAEMRLLAGVG